ELAAQRNPEALASVRIQEGRAVAAGLNLAEGRAFMDHLKLCTNQIRFRLNDFQSIRSSDGCGCSSAGLENTGLVPGDLRQGAAESYCVVKTDAGDRGDCRLDHVGQIE